jgi:tetratricopeptide (TPR) repeat protein
MDEGILAPLRDALPGDADLAGTTQLFAAHREPRLADADLLVDHWLDALATAESEPVRAAQLVWVFAGAATRYLAATRVAPSPLAGGLRTVASESLALLEREAHAVSTGTARVLLEVLDAGTAGVDSWTLDRWLLRLERALDLEERTGGHLGPFVAGLPRVADQLRGPERVAFELRLAEDLKDDGDPSNDDEARLLYERSLRAVGTAAVAAGWSEVSIALEVGLDVQHAAAVAAPERAGPQLALARALIAAGRPDLALAPLAAGLPLLDGAAREQRVAELAPHVAGVLPVEWTAARDDGLAHLAAGRAAEAARAFRWCLALDPGDAGLLQNLGLAHAALGDAAAACRAFCELDPSSGLALAARALEQAGHAALAGRVRRAGGAVDEDVAPEREWGRARAELVAGAARAGDEPVGEAALAAIGEKLDATAGTLDRDATLWRAHALALREEAIFPTDVPPPLGGVPDAPEEPVGAAIPRMAD